MDKVFESVQMSFSDAIMQQSVSGIINDVKVGGVAREEVEDVGATDGGGHVHG